MNTNTLYQWLRKNGPASGDIIAGHVAGAGGQNTARAMKLLRYLEAEGMVRRIDPDARPILWETLSVNPAVSRADRDRPYLRVCGIGQALLPRAEIVRRLSRALQKTRNIELDRQTLAVRVGSATNQ